MRVRVELDDELVAQIDELIGPRSRSAFVRLAVERAVRQELRWSNIKTAADLIENQDHDWDADPAEWVRQQRRAKDLRKG